MTSLAADALELARTLIQIPSVPGRGTSEVAHLLAERLQSSGLETRLHDYGGGNTNLIATWGEGRGPCLSGHMDTVTIDEDEWTVDPLGGEVRDGKLFGRGAVDMKAGVAALVTAAETYVASGRQNGFSLVFTAEEELGCLGATAMASAGLLPAATALLVAEPTSNRVNLGHRGALWVDLHAAGKACHASTPWLGENAAMLMIRAVLAIEAWAASHPQDHELLGPRTWSLGRLDGGVLRNIVPSACEAQLDFRTPTQEDHASIAEMLASTLGPGISSEFVCTLPPVLTSAASPWLQQVGSVFGSGHTTPGVSRFFTDASVLTPALGTVPTAICGPGNSDRAHTSDEYCDIEEIATFAEGVHRLLAQESPSSNPPLPFS